jgi:ADP-ribose pyrophosphatase YjhB (NUDIX family)
VVDGDRVLLARRSHSPWQHAWYSPGGFCDAGEHPIDTAEREVFEEVGLRVEVTGYIGVWVDEYADDPGLDGNETINVAYYLARPLGDVEAALDPAEVSELGWFAWDALPSPLAPPGTLESVLAAAREAAATPLLDRVPPVSP